MTMQIEREELAPDLSISRVLTGLWQIADLERDGDKLDPAATSRFMAPYVEAGFTTFDMADHYGSAEEIAGHFRRHSPLGEAVQLLTKWVPKPGPVRKEDVTAAVRRALDRLQTDRIDLLQYHAWNYADPAWLDSLFWLQELSEEGLIGQLGLTNFDAAHLRIAAASGIGILTNQVSYSLLDQRAAGEMTRVCREYGIRLLAYGTLAGGFLSEKWLGASEPSDRELSTWSQMKYKRFIDAAGGWPKFQGVLRTAAEIAGKHGVSLPVVAGRYMLDQPAVAGIILGARLGRSQHIDENLALCGLRLDSEDRTRLQEAIGQLEAIPGDCGDEYHKPPFLTAAGDLSDHLDEFPPVYREVRDAAGKARVSSGTVWEDMAGYSRAVRSGDRILVSGTTATHGARLIGGSDPVAQAHFVIDKIQAAVESLGGRLEDVDRTRIFVGDIEHWEPVARAHGQRFAAIRPVNTLVQARLVGPEYLVEMEAEARVLPGPG
jgi:aryl-alcohol dehydrogenase-like predicted oxidoreductase/enamine deaminase RidA (YjgF/YER057c/UK114 family)